MAGEGVKYGMQRTVALDFETADQRVREELGKEGFGVLTEIDVSATLKKKLDIDFQPYRILGACNPPLAHQALQAEIDIGLLLPCNVVLYPGEQEGTTVVAAIDPVVQLGVAEAEGLDGIAADVKARLERVLAGVA